MFEALGKEQPMTKAEYHAAFGDYTPEEVKEKVLEKHGNVDRAWHRSAKSKMSLKDFDAQAAEVHLFCLSLFVTNRSRIAAAISSSSFRLEGPIVSTEPESQNELKHTQSYT